MANDAYRAAEARWLREPDDQCDRCGDRTDGDPICWRCEDQAHEAELQATEGNERSRS